MRSDSPKSFRARAAVRSAIRRSTCFASTPLRLLLAALPCRSTHREEAEQAAASAANSPRSRSPPDARRIAQAVQVRHRLRRVEIVGERLDHGAGDG